MSVGSIGSTPSFWQQDQNYWAQAQENDNATAASNAVINAISSAETSLGKGLASIANQTALDRVNSQLTAAIQGLLTGNSDTSSSSSSGSSSSASGSQSSASPATGTGTAPLSISTPLATLGIPAGGSITVSAGGNTTTYSSTGTDTVGDLMHAINNDLVGNAAVTATLGRDGNLVITSKNDTDMVTIGGVYASNIGFGVGNNTFKATAGTAAASGSTASSTGSSSSGTSGSTASSTGMSSSAASTQSYVTLASETASSAASILSDSGVSGTLVNMLA